MAIKRGVRAPGHISRRLTPGAYTPPSVTAGQPIGLLLLLTKAS